MRETYETKKSANKYFSLRQYAHFLDLNSGTLSAVLSGKRTLSTQKALSIAKKLKLSKEETSEFLASMRKTSLPNVEETHDISLAQIKSREEAWEYSVVLALFKNKNFRATKKAIALKTGLPIQSVERVTESLIDKGCLVLNDQDQLMCKSLGLNVIQDWSTETSRREQKNNLLTCADYADQVPFSESKFAYVTICLDKRRLGYLKRKLTKLYRELEEMNEICSDGRLYRIALCAFPVAED